MRTIADFLRQNGSRFRWTAAVVFCAALLPEYAVPVLCATACIAVLRHTTKQRLLPAEMMLLAFMAWLLIGVCYARSVPSALVMLAEWILFWPLLLLTRSAVDDRRQLDALFLCGALSGGVSGGIGIAQMVLYHTVPALGKWFNPFWHFLDTAAANLWFRLLPENLAGHMQRRQFISIQTRASGTFTNPVFFAAFLCMMLPLCVHCMLFLHARLPRVLGGVSFALCAGGIAASYSRGPYLAIAVSFVVLLFYGKKYALRLLGVAAAALAVVALAARGVLRRLLTIFNSSDISVHTHAKIWQAGWRMLRGHWLFGYGTGVGGVREQLHETYHIAQPHAHNVLLELLLENGVIGLALFLAAFVLFLRVILRLARRNEAARRTAVTLLSSVAAFVSCGMTDYLFYGMKPMCYILLLLGFAQCADRIFAPPDLPQETNEKEPMTVGT